MQTLNQATDTQADFAQAGLSQAGLLQPDAAQTISAQPSAMQPGAAPAYPQTAPEQAEDAIIRVRNLTKQYGKRRILAGLNLTIQRGHSIALVGPSGSGKSTLLNMLGLLETPTSGAIELNGKPLPGINSRAATLLRRNTINYLFQTFALLNNTTVTQNIMIAMNYTRLSQQTKRHRIQQVLATLNLTHVADEKISTLSGGEQQRAAIARAILKPGELILADEPTGSLDRHLADQVFQQLLAMTRTYRKTLITVTHDPQIAQQCDRTVDLSAINHAGDAIADSR